FDLRDTPAALEIAHGDAGGGGSPAQGVGISDGRLEEIAVATGQALQARVALNDVVEIDEIAQREDVGVEGGIGVEVDSVSISLREPECLAGQTLAWVDERGRPDDRAVEALAGAFVEVDVERPPSYQIRSGHGEH